MTINLANNNPRIEYSVAQGATQQTFAVPFEFFNDSDITVYVDGVLKAEGTDYTLTGGDGSTGNVVFVTATPPAVQQVLGATGGSTVVIFRTTDIERTSDFSAGSDINRAALNEQLDILTAMIADQNDKTDRAIRLNDYEIAPSLTLPPIANLKGKVLAFNATTGDVEEGPTTDSIINVNTYAATASAAATSASASAASAAASFDSFDDRYLGAKTSDPALDNDGNALLTGALYYDSFNGLMKVYTGSFWSSLLVFGSNINANSTSPALRINQLGSGAALLVEDSANPDSTPFVVNSLGRVGIGTETPTSPLSIAGTIAKMDLLGTASASIAISADSIVSVDLKKAGDNNIGSRINFNKSRGTTAAPTPVISGDGIGHINYFVYQGLTQVRVSSIDSYVDTFTADNDFSTIITFSTRPNGVESPVVERLRIGPAGQIGIGGANYGTTGQTIVSAGNAAAPAWGTLPVAGGGTGVTTSTGSGSTVLSASPALTGTPTVNGSSIAINKSASALTDAATIAVDMANGPNFSVTLAGNRTLGTPTNQVVGMSGFIIVTQDATGSRTLSYAADWKWFGGQTPVLTTTANARDVILYTVLSSGNIMASIARAVP
jgi:hypothetical protein